ncbi:cobaltochelatase subunit CobN [Pelistega indica]|uniref:Cobaltochelatase subunit CobN n=1 Tax=Pelistega indica TaxID=1414851 RepID=V8G915_9BURK|nr:MULTISPECIES: cobaltochelatase subunit CobN [Pelistega]ETD72192.1 cobaltochelatase subunit CobN [Pelistega indica]
MQIPRLLLGIFSVFFLCWHTLTQGQTLPTVHMLHTTFVSEEKYMHLSKIAQQQGIKLVSQQLGQKNSSLNVPIDNNDVLIFDTPRPNDRAQFKSVWEKIRTEQNNPYLMIGGGRPESSLDTSIVKVLTALYQSGGERNYQRFFQLLKLTLLNQEIDNDLLVMPERVPDSAFYHPDAPQLFYSIQEYLRWYESYQKQQHLTVTGKVGFLTHSSVIGDMLTQNIDELVARSEAHHMMPIVFWSNGKRSLVEIVGKNNVDVLVNMTHLQNGEQLKKDFQVMNIPVIQTLKFREGSLAQWANAASGVNANTTALFLSIPESWGLSDPIVLSATSQGKERLIPTQAHALITKLKNLLVLKHLKNADKKIAIMFWNHPEGDKNIGASNLNVPTSIVSITQALKNHAYYVEGNLSEENVIKTAQRLLSAIYKPTLLDELRQQGLVALYPVDKYEQWLNQLPSYRKNELLHNGRLADHPAIREVEGKRYFLIPRWQIGNITVLPQLARHLHNNKQHYHDTHSIPDHWYMAAFLYLQENEHTLINLGTHGTQEWLPGKDRGLAAEDYSWLTAGGLPIFYPYIQDNVGEAIQAKRRGRAITISHQTPPFSPAGLYEELRDIHELIHQYEQADDGMTKEQLKQNIITLSINSKLSNDMQWQEKDMQAKFADYLAQLHDHLHEMANVATPLGLHTFGKEADKSHLITMVMQQLGESFYNALNLNYEERLFDNVDKLTQHPAYLAVEKMINGESVAPELAPFTATAQENYQRLQNTHELESLLSALSGEFVPAGNGGDPIRQPDIESGKNLYAFEATKIPTKAAYESAEQAFAQLVNSYRDAHQQAYPKKLAFSLWSSEAIRHMGITESQILYALGLRPVWNPAGKLIALEIIPTQELNRPRIDVVVQVTGVYRDQFDSYIRLLDEAIQKLSLLDEQNNLVADNTKSIASELIKKGLPEKEALLMAGRRLFGNSPGEYGTGVPHLAMHSTEWDDDSALAQQFLKSLQYSFGKDHWGQSAGSENLFAEQLKGTDMAVMARSSNVHGVLSTDHPFEFLGGLSSAIKHLDGKAPQLMISDLRQQQPKTKGLEQFLSDEMRVRYLNPQWIKSMQAEGYAGTVAIVNVNNNLFGWQVMDERSVRDDQWQAMMDVYIQDKYQLDMNKWFEQHNPTAQAQMIEKMIEAIRKGYWQASKETQQALVERWHDLENNHGVTIGAPKTKAFIEQIAKGVGFNEGAIPEVTQTSPNSSSEVVPQTSSEQVHGQVLQEVVTPKQQQSKWVLWGMLLMIAAGMATQWFKQKRYQQLVK